MLSIDELERKNRAIVQGKKTFDEQGLNKIALPLQYRFMDRKID